MPCTLLSILGVKLLRSALSLFLISPRLFRHIHEDRDRAMAEESKSGGGGAALVSAAPASPKVVLKSIDMNEKMRNDAIDCARAAFEKHRLEKDIAEYIKKEFDKKYGATWHCIVGRNFGSYVTHETNHFLYFYVDSKAVLLFKSG
ncbi:dynein light chain [Musa troglodytarum]|uniref:Dynein light chain n=1 Tax=Musa troglodytarum TaxID=320322 RepID=A0A9E7JH64_9LILI|nr:dynein light chain [Musa troglodytarum]